MDFPVDLAGSGPPSLLGLDPAGWILLGLSATGLVFLAWRWRRLGPRFSPGQLALAAALALSSTGVVLFTGAEFPLRNPVILPGRMDRYAAVLVWFGVSAPWLLAAGFSGPIGGMVAGTAAGAALAFFATHNPFTITIFAFLGLAAGWFSHQPYRTDFYRFVRRPAGAALAAGLGYPLLFAAGSLAGTSGALVERLYITAGIVWPESLAFYASLAVAAVLGEAAAALLPGRWGSQVGDRPSPAERSIETRSFQLMGLVVVGLVLLLSIIGWRVAHASALDLTRSRMIGAADLAAGSVPNALDTGQNLLQLALQDGRLAAGDPGDTGAALSEILQESRYFSELLLVSQDDQVLAAETRGGSPGALAEPELAGLSLAREGVPFQYYASDPAEGGTPITISFIAPVSGTDRVLLARSRLADNPFITPVLSGIETLSDIDGSGILVDGSGTILHHPVSQMVSTTYSGALETVPGFSETLGPDGFPSLVYALPVEGVSWMVLVEVPQLSVYAEALRIAVPLIGLLAALAVFSLLLLRVILRVVTVSLRDLSLQARRIAEDQQQLGAPVLTTGEDEIGRMRAAFEHMRERLKSRMDEQERLLDAGLGVASSLDFSRSVKPLMAAALAGGADSARVVLTADALPDFGQGRAQVYGAGPGTNRFAYLDSQVLHLLKSHDRLVLGNPVGFSGLTFSDGKDIPAAIAAVPLRQEQSYFGAMWIAYRKAHRIGPEEERFLLTLGTQGALAVANTRLFMAAEMERERLGAILASTPDPIIVTDREDALLLINPAAIQVLGDSLAGAVGSPIHDVVEQAALASALTAAEDTQDTLELKLETGEVYVARVTPVTFKGERIGRVAILRDFTRYRELEEFKTEFVRQLTHDLRSPLTLIGGYVTMLDLIGDLNPEQQAYTAKISIGVKRLTEIAEDMIAIQQAESAAPLRLGPVHPGDLLAEAADLVGPAAAQRDIRVETDFPVDLPLIEGDESLLRRAVMNLVDNAVKYSNDGGRVRVAACWDSEREEVRCSITDDGIGISLADQDRLFEPFFRASNEKTRDRKGTGLGLSLVKSVAEKHGGRVVVESEPGRGSTFHLDLPLRQG